MHMLPGMRWASVQEASSLLPVNTLPKATLLLNHLLNTLKYLTCS